MFYKTLNYLRLAIFLLYYQLFSFIGNTSFEKFIILTRSRTGSNLLVSLLNSHPSVYSEREIFARLNGRSYKNILSKVFSKQPFYIKAKGFKIFYYHPIDGRSDKVFNALKSIEGLKVIHLKRRNIFRTLISRKIAGNQNVWWTTKTSKENSKKVTFTVKEADEGFNQTRCWEKEGDKIFKNHDLITIYYEDLASNREATFRKITEFLGIKYSKPKTSLKRQNYQEIKDLVTNYDEIRMAFQGTKWQSFFEK